MQIVSTFSEDLRTEIESISRGRGLLSFELSGKVSRQDFELPIELLTAADTVDSGNTAGIADFGDTADPGDVDDFGNSDPDE